MPPRITSLQNQRVKDAVRLRDRHGRDDQQRIVIDGAREISRALQAGVQIVELFAVFDELSESDQQVADQANQAGAHLLDVTPGVMSKLAYGERDAGLVAIAHPPQQSLTDLSLPADAVVAVLEQVEKPGNIGAVVRSADATGVSAVIVADGRTDIFNPNAIRASAGTIFSMPVIATTAAAALQWLRDSEFRIVGTRVDAADSLWEVSFVGRVAIVLGNESLGLSQHWSAPGVQPVRVPQQGAADSLNVSVTAALLFYEAFRQRKGDR